MYDLISNLWLGMGVAVTPMNVFLRVTDPGSLTAMSVRPSGGCTSAVSSTRDPGLCGAIP